MTQYSYTATQVMQLKEWMTNKDKFIKDHNLNPHYGTILHYAFFNSDVSIGIVGAGISASNVFLQSIKPAILSIASWKRPETKRMDSYEISFDNGSSIYALGMQAPYLKGRMYNMLVILEPVTNDFMFTTEVEDLYDCIIPLHVGTVSNFRLLELG